MKSKFKKLFSSVLLPILSLSMLTPGTGFAAASGTEAQGKDIPFPSQSNSRTLSFTAFSDGTIGNGNVEARIGSDGRFSAGIKELGNENWFRVIYGWSGSTGTSFTTVKVDGQDKVFGNYPDGVFLTNPRNVDDQTNESVWKTGDVTVKQALKSTINPATGIDDAIQVRYTMTNVGNQPHDVGLRMMIDTMVGWNDSAPFKVPTQNGVESIDYEKDFTGSEVPDFWQAFQSFDNPDISAQYTMRGNNATAPDRFAITNWGGIRGTLWDYNVTGNRGTGDSAVGMWWNPVTIQPGETKTITTYYGRPGVGGDHTLVLSGRQRLTYNEWSTSSTNLIAYLTNNTTNNLNNVNVEIVTRDGLRLSENDASHSLGNLAVGSTTQTTWRIQPTKAGVHTVTVNAYANGSTEPFTTSEYQVEALESVVPPNISIGGDRGTNNQGNPIVGRTSPITINASYDNPQAVAVRLIATDADGDRYEAPMVTGNSVDWTHTFSPYNVGLWQSPMTIQIIPTYEDGEGVPQEFNVELIDPRGVIYNAAAAQPDGELDSTNLPNWPLPGATVVLQYNDPEIGTWVNMTEDAYPGRLSPITNPQITGEDGVYAWDVAEGQYRVVVSRPGFETVTSRIVNVPPPVLDLHVGLTPTDAVAPTITVSGVDNGETYNGPVTIQFNANDDVAGVRKVTYTIDNGEEQQANGASGSFSIEQVGNHTINFTVVDHAGNHTTKEISFTLNSSEPQDGEFKINAITTNLVSPQQTGNTIRWTADANGTGLSYEWNLYKNGALIQKLPTSNQNYVELTPTEEGIYKAMVVVRDNKNHLDHKYSSEFTVITEASAEELKINSIMTNVVSPQQIENTIRWTADVSGNGVKYEWNIYKNGKLVHKLPVSNQNYVEFTPTEEGSYKVMVAVRDLAGDFDHKYSSEFIAISEEQVEELKINSITANLVSPHPIGNTVRWTADVDGNGLQYEWSIYKDGAVIQRYTFMRDNAIEWTPTGEGKYKVKVGVKDIFNNYKYSFSSDFMFTAVVVEPVVIQDEVIEGDVESVLTQDEAKEPEGEPMITENETDTTGAEELQN